MAARTAATLRGNASWSRSGRPPADATTRSRCLRFSNFVRVESFDAYSSSEFGMREDRPQTEDDRRQTTDLVDRRQTTDLVEH